MERGRSVVVAEGRKEGWVGGWKDGWKDRMEGRNHIFDDLCNELPDRQHIPAVDLGFNRSSDSL